MNIIDLMRTAEERRNVVARYDQLEARFSRMEDRFRSLRQSIPAEDAHALALMVMRAQISETDNPEPEGIGCPGCAKGCVGCPE